MKEMLENRGLFFLTQIMKKINNKKSIILYNRIFVIFLVSFSLTGIFLFLLIPKSFSLLFSIIVVGIISTLIFRNLKFFEFENSIQFISIRQSYFWRLNRVISPIEFPNYKLLGFGVHKVLFTTSLMLLIEYKDHKTKKIYCKITGLSKSQISELKLSLQNAKEYDEN